MKYPSLSMDTPVICFSVEVVLHSAMLIVRVFVSLNWPFSIILTVILFEVLAKTTAATLSVFAASLLTQKVAFVYPSP
jgi:hypothetical protein